MDYDGYEQDLYHIYESEVLGETMFGLIARLSVSADRKRKWEALAELETQTMQRYLDFVADKPVFASKSRPSSFLGSAYGLLFTLLPWKTAMKMLSDGTEEFMVVFKRLAAHAEEVDMVFFNYVVAHEEAIKAFADLELRGEPDLSLQPVTELLDQA